MTGHTPDPFRPWRESGDRYSYDFYEALTRQPEPTDAVIKARVVDCLRQHDATKDDDIRVDVKRNVVILTGDVASERARREAGKAAGEVEGVVDVSNQLSVGRRSGEG